MPDLPATIRAFRATHDLTQAELGRLLNVPANTIARWERGDQDVRHPSVLLLALERLGDLLHRPER